MHADGGTGSAKMAESERELLSAKPVGSLPPPVMRAVRHLVKSIEKQDLYVNQRVKDNG